MSKDEVHKKLEELHSKMDINKNGEMTRQEFVKFLKDEVWK